ncbi:MAG: ribosome biogenesis GTPase Der [Thermodesulfobacterium sp.]|nr:ribosome biogenesis GTPase Der [Thermodesulfobacterium sp.]
MFKVLIVGRPNVGKSTLFNTLIGERKAIVERSPGVTRDFICGYVEVENNKGFMLIDTGGLSWEREDFFSQEIFKRVELLLKESSLVLLVVDAKEGLTSEDFKIADYLRKTNRETILVVNKVESREEEERVLEFYRLGFKKLIFISAKNRKNIEELKEQIKEVGKEFLEEIPEVLAKKIAVLGRPNVGKSTLINRLIGYERMMVSEIPGTTRDCIDVVLTLPNGKNYLLIDTPGIRRRAKIEERVEKFSVDKALEVLKKVDIVLLVISAEEGLTHQDKRLLRQVEKNYKACILLVNKWDLLENKGDAEKIMLEKLRYGLRFIPWLPVLPISALKGKGIKKILPLVEEIYSQYSLRVSTSLLNRVLEELKGKYTFTLENRKLKFYYATQVDIRPPTFVIFVNISPERIPLQVEKFFRNQIKTRLGFTQVPVKVIFRLRD